jgi:hypothetical protein
MQPSLSEPTPPSPILEDKFIARIRQDGSVISSVSSIIEKMSEEGLMTVLHDSIKAILTKELQVSYLEFSKIDLSDQQYDIVTLYTNNFFIFKENLKMISGFVSWLNSRLPMERVLGSGKTG